MHPGCRSDRHPDATFLRQIPEQIRRVAIGNAVPYGTDSILEETMSVDQAAARPRSSAAKGRAETLSKRLFQTRDCSSSLAEPLSDEDQVVQAMEDASPTKWHLAHTTWFFEAFLLTRSDPDYKVFDEDYAYCFNSYYEGKGERHPRPHRGLLTRPGAADVRAYRAYVDEALARFLDDGGASGEVLDIVELGINHEQQHQELLLTDILSLFASQPLRPTYTNAQIAEADKAHLAQFIAFDGGIAEVGHDGNSFAYDNEGPRHEALIQPFRLADRCVTKGQWLEFMDDGGYEHHAHWLMDGWSMVNAEGWRAPLYWQEHNGEWMQMTLSGLRPVDPAAPVAHVSYYEADAFARWAGKRLPTEFEWEHASQGLAEEGRTLGSGAFRPSPAGETDGTLQQMFGDVWEWTQSHYSPYPGYRPPEGAVGEYNGKFMCGQFVLKGGSCATPDGHVRRTYRNFFYPHQRWQFKGLRLAEDQ
jgi:ergothioneine biosynthesis protein EgtB